MRTTVEIPDDLFERAKRAALDRGTTLKEVVVRALRREIDEGATIRRRVDFPIVRSERPASVRIANADIEAMQTDEESGG